MNRIDSVDHSTSHTSDILLRAGRNSDYLPGIANPLSISRFSSNEYELDIFKDSEATYRRHIPQHAIRSVGQEAMLKASIAPNNQSVGERRSSPFMATPDSFRFNFYDQAFYDLLRDMPSSNVSMPKSIILTELLQSPTYLATQINGVARHEDIFDILDLANHQKIVERLRYLHEITRDDDPEDPAMKFLSLRELALFFTGDGNSLPYPQIGISPDGSLQAEWRSRKASAVMKFLTDGNTRFAGTMGNQDDRQTIQGSGTKNHALQSILRFIDHSYS